MNGMFPNSNHAPTGPLEPAGGFTVAEDISGDFALPIVAVVSGHPQVLGATVPEAAVHEDRKAFSAEDEIGLAGKGLVSAPAGDAVGAENGGEPQFRGAVSGGPDRGHDLGAFLLCEHVGHGGSCSTTGRG